MDEFSDTTQNSPAGVTDHRTAVKVVEGGDLQRLYDRNPTSLRFLRYVSWGRRIFLKSANPSDERTKRNSENPPERIKLLRAHFLPGV